MPVTSLYCPHCNDPISPGTKFCASCGHQLETPEEGSQDRLIGQFIGGRFRVESKLGEGGMGAVYQAEQVAMKRKIALKVLHAHLSSDEQLIERFHREAAASSRLNHPNTITVHDFGQTDDGTLYIAMEYIEGKNLADVIDDDGAMPWSRAVHICLQVAESLADAHEQGIVHRDLKPDNVMLYDRAAQTDFVKILDFGIAKMAELAEGEGSDKRKALTKTGMIFGTPQYMSPEQIRGSGVDHRTDIYSLGVILYHLVAGDLPFTAENPMGMLTKHLMEPPRPLAQSNPGVECPTQLESLIMKCLEKDQNLRYQSLNAIVRELKTMANETRPGFAIGTPPPVGGVGGALTSDPGSATAGFGSQTTPAPGASAPFGQQGSGGFASQPPSGGFVNQPSSGGFGNQVSTGGFGASSTGGLTPSPAVSGAQSSGAGKTILIALVIIGVLAGLGVGAAFVWRSISGGDDGSDSSGSTAGITPPVMPPPVVPPPVAPPPVVPVPTAPPVAPPIAPPTPISPVASSPSSPSKIAPCAIAAAGGAKATKASRKLALSLLGREKQFGLCFASLVNSPLDGNLKLGYRWGRNKGPHKIKALKTKNQVPADTVMVCLKTVLSSTTHPDQTSKRGVGILEFEVNGGGGALKTCKISARVPVRRSKGPKPPGWTPPAGYYPPYGGYGGYGGY